MVGVRVILLVGGVVDTLIMLLRDTVLLVVSVGVGGLGGIAGKIRRLIELE